MTGFEILLTEHTAHAVTKLKLVNVCFDFTETQDLRARACPSHLFDTRASDSDVFKS